MNELIKVLGKVVPTREGEWKRDKAYEDLSMVYDKDTLVSYISRKYVPEGVNITNREYWQPQNVIGIADNNIIVINDTTESGSLVSYTLDKVLKTIPEVSRKLGTMVSFYNGSEDREDVRPSWELWQFNSVDIREWEDTTKWVDCLHKYVYSTFLGWFTTKARLTANYPHPVEGLIAFVGTNQTDSYVYRAEYDEFSQIVVWTRRQKLSTELNSYNSLMASVSLTTERLIHQIGELQSKVTELTEELETIKNSI